MTKQHIEFVLSGYGVPYTDALADKLLEMFDEEAASYLHTINELNKALSKNKGEDRPKGEWKRMSDLPEDKDDRYECSRCGNVIHYKKRMDLYTFNSWCGRCGSNNNPNRYDER